jgi:pimeloyl-ACP methyl ester carboxylesterase
MSYYQKLYHSNQESFTAYHKISAKQTNKLGIIFLGGFNSDMNGTKAQNFAQYALEQDYDFIRFDYFGHGISSGKFEEGTIGQWLEDSLRVIDQLTDKPQILIGSSMGGWLMLLAALARPNKIAGLIGLATATDFTEDLIWEKFTTKQKEEILREKQIHFANEFCSDPYLITLNLIEEARNHLMLDKPININIPVHLFHGMNDQDVPYQTSLKIAERLTGKDVDIHLIKNAGHRLSEANELAKIHQTISIMMQNN